MHHFFASPDMVKDSLITIKGTDVNHIKNVLRMKIGEEALVSDGAGKDYMCEIDSYTDDSVIMAIKGESEARTELDTRFYLFQGLPKSEKMELIIQKTVELGVYEVIPVNMKRCIVKLDDKKKDSKIKRWQAISKSAAKQSKRGIVPEVKPVMSFKEAINYAKDFDIVLMPYENHKGMKETKEILSEIKHGMKVGIFIGPEGGFDEAEVALASENGIKPITLGHRILRTETAGLCILSVLMFMCEED